MPWLPYLIAPAAVVVAAALTMPMILVVADADQRTVADREPVADDAELKAFAAASLLVEAVR